MEEIYSVKIEDFALKHFIKKFAKKYKKHWDVTLDAIIAEFERIDSLVLTDRTKIISEVDDLRLIKTKFRVAGTKESAKSSGNRCIVVWNTIVNEVKVLLVYGKTDIGGGNETAEWKRLISENYTEYK